MPDPSVLVLRHGADVFPERLNVGSEHHSATEQCSERRSAKEVRRGARTLKVYLQTCKGHFGVQAEQ
ncbi:hypothetical protein TIFTF001_021949 [Ficus carica]|uniref:Uncharacterized protein n=1 Tax=Ficus carica TaxID=3494 RepID=A0AA88DCF8_FICCA|nr:hypothetical protein TIFTF001_021949 [Ficus carica]